ncbi:MAG: hypothetical protein II784_00955, partial [Oscillospiraceae bacterium]|nr:hypothetical protein [Oscillospiraceae bacterium]
MILPGLSLLFGAAGFALRGDELRTAFELGNGLFIAGKPATAALIILSVVFAALCILLLLRERGKLSVPDSFSSAFNCAGPSGFVFFAAYCVSAALMLAGGIALLLSSPQKLGLVFAVVSIASGACVSLRALALRRSGGSTRLFNAVTVIF